MAAILLSAVRAVWNVRTAFLGFKSFVQFTTQRPAHTIESRYIGSRFEDARHTTHMSFIAQSQQYLTGMITFHIMTFVVNKSSLINVFSSIAENSGLYFKGNEQWRIKHDARYLGASSDFINSDSTVWR